MWYVCKVSSHLLHSPQSHPLHQAPSSCLVKGSPLLHISSRVRQGDKGGCWSNTQTNSQWQKHTFVAQRLALISWLCQEPKREASLSLWTGACQRFLSLSHSLMHKFSLPRSLSWRSMSTNYSVIYNPPPQLRVRTYSPGRWGDGPSAGCSRISSSVTEIKAQVMLRLIVLDGGCLVGWQRPIIVKGIIGTAVSLWVPHTLHNHKGNPAAVSTRCYWKTELRWFESCAYRLQADTQIRFR